MITVTITGVEGSTPRDVGAFMVVTLNDFSGTIGGGALEFHAIAMAREMLEKGEKSKSLTLMLGPILGQCCGGKVDLLFDKEAIIAPKSAHPNLYLFGKGHVGKAIIEQAKLLPFTLHAFDEREGDDCLGKITAATPQSIFLILTHSHALDYILTEQALLREDALYVGLIGSKTKRAQFLNARKHMSLTNFHCPIGFKTRDKRPEVISALTLAQILTIVCP